jgi:cytochrome c peroxidase
MSLRSAAAVHPRLRTRLPEGLRFDKVDVDRITQAIAAFEETLVTPNSRFDKWLKGDKKALNKTGTGRLQAVQGQRLRCLSQWPAVGGNSFQKMGVVEPIQGFQPGRRAAPP